MTYISILGWSSFFLAMASYFCGAFAIIRGPAHPSIISRFFWLALSITNFLSYLKIGAGTGSFLALSGVLGSALIFVLSLRYGYIEFKRSDIITVIGASIALGCYLLLTHKFLALLAGLVTHFISGIPTYRKTWPNPYAEDLLFWLLFALASLLSLIAVTLQGMNIVYPLYFLLFDAGMTTLIVRQRYVLRQAGRQTAGELVS